MGIFTKDFTYKLAQISHDQVEFTVRGKSQWMRADTLVNEHYCDHFNEADRLQIAQIAKRLDPNIEVHRNRGSIVVYNRALLFILPMFAMIYGISVVLSVFEEFTFAKPFGYILSLGVIPISLAYTAEDIITELYGFTTTLKVAFQTFIILVLFSALIKLSFLFSDVHIPSSLTEALAYIPNDLFGSAIAVLVASCVDLAIFSFIKYKMRGKHFWIRSLLSTFISQIVSVGTFLLLNLFLQVITFSEISQMWYLLWSTYIAQCVLGTLFLLISYPTIYAVRRYSARLARKHVSRSEDPTYANS